MAVTAAAAQPVRTEPMALFPVQAVLPAALAVPEEMRALEAREELVRAAR